MARRAVGDDDVRLGLQIRLRANGYQVFEAGDAESGIGQARRCCPGVILLDLGLPRGDGWVVLRELAADDALR